METRTQGGVVQCEPPQIDHLDGHGYLFGYPVHHSMSPLLHKTIFDSLGLNFDYFLLNSMDVSQFVQLVRSPKCYGSGVTMPHKLAILPSLDEATPECKAVGACNTIFKRGSRLIGTNTDIVGVRESFYQNVPAAVFERRPGMVIGGGGAARSAVYALMKHMRCGPIYIVNRDPREVASLISWGRTQGYGDELVHVETVSRAEELEGPGAIVACVPNYQPVTEAEWEARRVLQCFLSKPHKGAILEMCYHPTPWTEIGSISERAGWQVILGTEAMIYQGFEQSRCWTGRQVDEMPVQEVKQAVARELSKAQL